jgi:hypothetical protein
MGGPLKTFCSGRNRADGAGTRAGAAINAFRGVYNPFAVLLRDSGYGAGRLARAAVNTAFGVDFICHNLNLLKNKFYTDIIHKNNRRKTL